MSDPIDDVFAEIDRDRKKGRASSAPPPSSGGNSWGDYIQNGVDFYKETPWLGKPFGWVKGVNDAIERGEQTVEPYVGKTAAKILSAPARAQSFGAEMFFGSPADLVGTAAAIPTLGESLFVTAGPKVAAKLPSAARAVAPYARKALNYAGRASDAVQSAYMAGEATGEARKGNYGTALMQGGGSLLSGIGAADYWPLATPKADRPVTGLSDFDREFELGARRRGEHTNLEAERLSRERIRRSQEPTRIVSRTITDESRLLPEHTEKLINRPRGATGTVLRPKDDALAERAVRDFDALGLKFSGDQNNDQILRYINDAEWRSFVQGQVAEIKRTGQVPSYVEPELRKRQPAPNMSQEARDALVDKYYASADFDEFGLPATGDIHFDADGNIVTPAKKIASALTEQEVNALQDMGRLDREGANNIRLVTRGADPMNVNRGLQPTTDEIPWDSPAGEYNPLQSGPIQPGTPPTFKPSTTVIKRSHDPITELGSESPNTSGYYPRTTHVAPEDTYVDEFGGYVTQRELPADAKIFDLSNGISQEQLDQVQAYLTKIGKPIDEYDLKNLSSLKGNALNSELTDLFNRSVDITPEKRARLNQLLDAKDASEGTGFTGLTRAEVREIATIRREMRDSNKKQTDTFRNFMKENGYDAAYYRGISSQETNGPQLGYAIVDPSGLPTTKTLEAGGTLPRVGRTVTREGEQLPGPRQVLAMPGGNYHRPVVRNIDDVRQALIAQGMPEPTNEFVRKIYNDPKLLDKVVPPRTEYIGPSRGMDPEGLETSINSEGIAERTRGLLNSADPEDVRQRAHMAEQAEKYKAMVDKADDIATKLEKAKGVIGDTEFGQLIDRVKTKQLNWGQKIFRGLTQSMETELEKMGEGGKSVARLFKTATTDSVVRFNGYTESFFEDLQRVKQDDFEKIVDALEGKKVTLTPELDNLKNRIEGTLKQTGLDMDELGLLEKGTRGDYFPHRYDGVPVQTLREAMRKEGMSEDQISKNINEIQSNREMKTRGEYSRNDLNVPGYRKDKNVLIDHLRDTAKRVEHARVFGAKDINDPTSQLSRFIAASENPERAKDLADRILRGGRQVSPESRAASKAIRNYATAAHLSLSAISQIGGAVPIAMKADIKKTLEGLGTAWQNDPNAKFMRRTNMARDFAEHFNDGAAGDFLYKAFGVKGVQNYMNVAAGKAGYAQAQSLFSALKKDPTNEIGRMQLEDLVHTPIKDVLNQGSLTEKQLQRSMVRMAEMTQGTADAKNLPYHWVGNGSRLIPQIFQRMAFQGSRAIKDAIKQNPKKIITLATTGLVAGEVIGNLKEIPKTAAEVATNSVSQQLGYTTEDKDLFTFDPEKNELLQNMGITKDDDDTDRFGYTRKMLGEVNPEWAKDENIVRGVANLMNSYAFGMPGDMLMQAASAFGERRPLDEIGRGFWAYEELGDIAGGLQDLGQGNTRDPGREIIRRIPFVGTGINREIATDREAGGGRSVGRRNAAGVTQGSW